MQVFDLHTTRSLQNLIVVPYMEVFLIESWDQTKQDEQLQLSDKQSPFKGNCSTWATFSDNRLPCKENLYHLKGSLRQAVSMV